MSDPTTEYKPWNQDEAGRVFSILIYSFWDSLSATPPLEPNFRRGMPADAPIDPLVWGGLYSESYGALKIVRQSQWVCGILFWTGIILTADLLPRVWGISDIFVMVLGIICLTFSLVVHLATIRRLKFDMRIAMETINPILERAGYRVSYEINSTGICYTAEHFFQIYFHNVPNQTRVLDLLARTETPMPREPQKVYMHAPWYRHVLLWKCGLNRHDFFDDPQPKSLRAIHPYIWGSLRDSFYSHEMQELCYKRTRVVNLMLTLAIFTFFTIRDGRPWWIPVALLLAGAVAAFFFFERLLTDTSRKLGHDKWLRKVNWWRRIMEARGWQLEYHHKDEIDDTWRTKLLFGGAPSDFVRFVPIHNP